MTDTERQKLKNDIDKINAMPVKSLAIKIYLHNITELLKRGDKK